MNIIEFNEIKQILENPTRVDDIWLNALFKLYSMILEIENLIFDDACSTEDYILRLEMYEELNSHMDEYIELYEYIDFYDAFVSSKYYNEVSNILSLFAYLDNFIK